MWAFAFSQLSQRYVDESEANFVVPPAIIGDDALFSAWKSQVESAQVSYVALVDQLMERYAWVADKVHRRKMAREAARGVLPELHRDQDRDDRQRARVAHDARATQRRRRRARDQPLRGRDPAEFFSRKRRHFSRTSRSTPPTIARKQRASRITRCDADGERMIDASPAEARRIRLASIRGAVICSLIGAAAGITSLITLAAAGYTLIFVSARLHIVPPSLTGWAVLGAFECGTIAWLFERTRAKDAVIAERSRA